MKNKKIDHGNGLVEHIIHYEDKSYFHYTILNDKFHGEFKEDGELDIHCFYENGVCIRNYK